MVPESQLFPLLFPEFIRNSEGELTLDGKPYKPADTLDAQNHGISMIAQEMGTLPGIKVADNLFYRKRAVVYKTWCC